MGVNLGVPFGVHPKGPPAAKLKSIRNQFQDKRLKKAKKDSSNDAADRKKNKTENVLTPMKK